MKTTPNQTAFLGSCEADTLGIVVDLHDKEGRNLAQETVNRTGDLELRNLVILAKGLGNRYLVAVSKFNNTGIFGAICDNDQSLVAAFQMANERMDEMGSRTTGWMFKPDACAVLLNKASLKNDQKGDK